MPNPDARKNLPGPGPGRPKGVLNKLTADLKAALLAPFDPKKFKAWAEKKPDAYFTLIITKLLPKDLNFRLIKGLDDLTPEELAALAADMRAKGLLDEPSVVAPSPNRKGHEPRQKTAKGKGTG